MKKFFIIFFVTLGIIFFVLIVGGICFFIADPLNLKSMMLFRSASTYNGNGNTGTTKTGADQNSLLSDTQEKALETFGIDPASIPASFTPEQETCFTGKLGAERVAQIKAGDAPTATEYFKAKDCI